VSASVNVSGTTHTTIGTYNNDPWTFTNPNYNSLSGAVNDSILWKFTLTPLASPVNLGSTEPIRWTLQDAAGNTAPLSAVVKIESIFNGSMPSGGCVATTGVSLTLYAPGGTGLTYLPPFQFNWNTSTANGTGGGCYTVRITFNDGTAKITNAVQLIARDRDDN
jgi:hypothetical protein